MSTDQIVVQKYGGSSVADAGRIQRVAQKIQKRVANGQRLVVVVSAMGDTTDNLLTLAKSISKDPPRRELDMLLTTGERISMALLAMALHELGVPAVSFTGSQSGIITDDTHAQARILEVKPSRIVEALRSGNVVIVAGYQGVSRNREVTTLGRGGSDTSAVALAAAFGADCEIYSDVDGVYTADPRVVSDARRLSSLSYEEMQELAVAGAKVLNAQAVEFARDHGIVIHALSTFVEGPGTAISRSPESTMRVKGVTADSRIWLVASRRPADQLTATLATCGLRARGVWSSGDDTTAVVSLEDVHGEEASEAKLAAALGNDGSVRKDTAIVTCVGVGLASDAPLVSSATQKVKAVDASARLVQSSHLSLAFVVSRDLAVAATRVLHEALVSRSSELTQ